MQKQKAEILQLEKVTRNQLMQIIRLKKELSGVKLDRENIVRERDRDNECRFVIAQRSLLLEVTPNPVPR